MRFFADDSKIYEIINDEEDEKQLQCDLTLRSNVAVTGNIDFALSNARFSRDFGIFIPSYKYQVTKRTTTKLIMQIQVISV